MIRNAGKALFTNLQGAATVASQEQSKREEDGEVMAQSSAASSTIA